MRYGPCRWVYLALSLVAPLYYGTVTWLYVFSHPFIVQDDMRQHVVWFQQFLDPAIFQDDAIARYFLSVAPAGVTAVYRLGAFAGIEPLLLAQLLPLPLALIATGFLFYTSLAIAPVPLAAWLATLIFNQHLWLNDDLVTATPRAFVYPLFAAFLYCWVKRSLWVVLAIALLGLFFPQMMLVAVAMLGVRLVQWGRPPRLTRDRREWQLALWGLGVAIAVGVPFALSLSDYGPAITAEHMRLQPDYGPGGRSEYFGVNPLSFGLHGSSGLRIPVFPSIIWAGFALPFMVGPWVTWLGKPWRSPVLAAITPQVRVLSDLMLASFTLFLLAHLLLLRLHFPSRYTYHSWRFALSVAAGLVLAALVDLVRKKWRYPWRIDPLGSTASQSGAIAKGLCLLGAIVVIGVPMMPPLMLAFQGWIVGDIPAVYTYLRTQPPDTLVASLAPEANNIPAFAHRSVWVGREFNLPHHPRYYEIMSDRTAALLHAHYSPDITALTTFIEQTGVDFFLIERSAFQPEYLQQDWLLHSVLHDQVVAIQTQLKQQQAALAHRFPSCETISTSQYALVKADCLHRPASPPSEQLFKSYINGLRQGVNAVDRPRHSP